MNKIVIIALCLAFSCKEKSSDSTVINSGEKKAEKKEMKVFGIEKIDPSFDAYMPDTSINFPDRDSLGRYNRSKYIAIEKYYEEFFSGKEPIAARLEEEQIRRKFDDFMQYNQFKFYKSKPKDIRSMSLLSMHSPYSKLVSLNERISFYHTFPDHIKNSETGKKTWEMLQSYNYDKNLNKNISQWNNMKIVDTNKQTISFQSVFDPDKQYYILVYGAYWCGPCITDELKVKSYLPEIDTSTIQFIGLSTDNNIPKWQSYLEKYKWPWRNYLLKEELDNVMIKELDFQGVPRNFLIDSTGKIIMEHTSAIYLLNEIMRIEYNKQG